MDANELKKEIVRISRLFYQRGWSFATSGNYSARLENSDILITASGCDKGLLTEEDFVQLTPEGAASPGSKAKPSAEAYLHCELYRGDPEIGAVLHTHSVFSTVLSSLPKLRQPLSIQGYEMLKALRGVTTHIHAENIPVFPNSQDMNELAHRVTDYRKRDATIHAFLIAGHGLYCWGRNLGEALRHAEALEFLLECEYRRLVESGKL